MECPHRLPCSGHSLPGVDRVAQSKLLGTSDVGYPARRTGLDELDQPRGHLAGRYRLVRNIEAENHRQLSLHVQEQFDELVELRGPQDRERDARPLDDLLAVGIGAAQGALFAAQFRDRRLDLLGVAIIGIATGFGGGILRDVLLSEVPAALTSNWYLIVATAAALIGMLLERLISRLGPLVTILDALTIGLFAAIGTTKGLAAGLPVVPAIFLGVLSAVGGSILRDLLLNRPIALMHVGSLYAIAAFAGTILLVVLLSYGVPVFLAAAICVAVTFGVRVLAVLFNWTLPEQRAIEKLPRIRRR